MEWTSGLIDGGIRVAYYGLIIYLLYRVGNYFHERDKRKAEKDTTE